MAPFGLTILDDALFLVSWPNRLKRSNIDSWRALRSFSNGIFEGSSRDVNLRRVATSGLDEIWAILMVDVKYMDTAVEDEADVEAVFDDDTDLKAEVDDVGVGAAVNDEADTEVDDVEGVEYRSEMAKSSSEMAPGLSG